MMSPDEETVFQSIKNEQTLGVDFLLDWCDGKLEQWILQGFSGFCK